ncbi:MAG: DUF2279 domain-containing protein [Flavobacteriales bacterium]
MTKLKHYILFISLFFSSQVLPQDSLSFFEPAHGLHKKRFTYLTAGTGIVYTGSMIALNQLWYKGHERSVFHFFNDNDEWMQVDKAGHFMSSYYMGFTGERLLNWSGVQRNKAIWYGGMAGSFFLSSVEIFDGFSEQWGFSYGDMIANLGGSALFISQEKLWGEQRIKVKYSFHRTPFSDIRPELLGQSFNEELLKDYNGQTYWLDFNISSFIPGNDPIPNWLAFSAGYGAKNMLGGENNLIDGLSKDEKNLKRNRRFYFSLDIDLHKIKTHSEFLNTLLHTFGFIKIPAPAVILKEEGGVGFDGFYF